MKYDLEDFTFILIVRLDSMIRLENLLAVVHFLYKNFLSHIWVVEVDAYCNEILRKLIGRKAKYCFIEDYDPIFYRTKYINFISTKITSPFLCIWDVDVLAPVDQIREAAIKMRTGECDVVLPYNKVLDTSMCIREMYMQNKSISFLCRQVPKMDFLYKGLNLRGGAVFIRTEAYWQAGMENLQFYGWGSEDFERYDRLKKLGNKIQNIEGTLFHLSHPRGINSKHYNADSWINSDFALYKTRVASVDELKKINVNNNKLLF